MHPGHNRPMLPPEETTTRFAERHNFNARVARRLSFP